MDLPRMQITPELEGKRFDLEDLLKFLETHNATLSFREVPNVIEGEESPLKLLRIKIPQGESWLELQKVIDRRQCDQANFPLRSHTAEKMIGEMEREYPRLRVR